MYDLFDETSLRQALTPYIPAENIENILEFDPDALSRLFG